DGPTRSATQSRGLKFAIDERRRTVRLTKSYTHPNPLLASSMGNVQLLPSGHAVVGWGAQPFVSLFSPEANLIADLRMVAGQLSYRGLRLRWSATPASRPAIAVRRQRATGLAKLYASWNGATDVAHWQVLAGPTART